MIRVRLAWRMLDAPVTPLETPHRGRRIGTAAGLHFVYEGNVPGGGGENTHCAACGDALLGEGMTPEARLTGSGETATSR